MARKGRRPRFEIWQVGGRIHSVDNPVRLSILRLLEAGPQRLTSLVQATAKAKSTLSALHIPPLVAAGLIDETADKRDARVKVYALRGHRLGSSDVDVPQLRDAVLQYVHESGAAPVPALLDAVDPAALVESGASPAYVDAVARRIGRAVGRLLTTTDPRAAVAELRGILAQARLGELEWGAEEAPTLRPASPRLGVFVARLVDEALGGRARVRVSVPEPRSVSASA